MKLDFPGRKAVFSALFKEEQHELDRLRARLKELEAVESRLTDEHLRSEKLASRITALENELAASRKAVELGDKDYFINLLEGKTEGVSVAGLRSKFGSRDAVRIARALYDVVFANTLKRGCSLSEAAATAVRTQATWGDAPFPMPIVLSLVAQPSTRQSGLLALGILLARRNILPSALNAFLQADRDEVRKLAWPEFIRTLASSDRGEAAREVTLVAELPLPGCDSDALYTLVRVLSGNGFIEDAMKLVERIKRSPESASLLVGPLKGQVDWFAAYDKIKAAKCEWHKAAARSGAPVVAVVDYKQPDIAFTSSNIGDYIQTISMLGCIARLSNIEIEGHDTLTSVASQLRGRVRQDRIATGQGGKIALTVVDRDATLDVPPPPGTWMLAFGWHMHKSFTDSLAFPFHRNVRPIFISFHCNKPEMLTADGVDYLKRFAPIGCRDWTTVYFLRSRGVPAFFSGCVTATIDTLFALPEKATQSRQTAFIDITPTAEERNTPFKQIAHAQPTYRLTGFASNLQRAAALLDEYRTQYDRIVTSRLHAYLPCVAIGLNVEFRPNNPSDIRFDGLANLGREEIEAIRAPLLAKTADILNLIAQGAGSEEVYSTWAEMCREDVEKANARCSEAPDIRLLAEDVGALVAGAMKGRVSYGEFDQGVDPLSIVHIGLAADKGYTPYLCVVLQSILRNSRRPIQFHVLARGFEQKHYDLIGARFASGKCCVQFFPCDDIDHGYVIGMYARTTASTMDRLLLPKLLPEVDKIAYIDIDTVVLGEVGELYDLDLAGHPLAACGSFAPEASGGFSHVIPASVRLTPDRAIEFRRRMAARTDLAYPTFNAGVLVLDLKQLREIDFCEQFLPYVSRYGLNDQELLNCFAGGNWRPLPKDWNARPTQELLENPKLVHFVSFTKPWMGSRLPFSDAWEAYQSEVSDLVTLLP